MEEIKGTFGNYELPSRKFDVHFYPKNNKIRFGEAFNEHGFVEGMNVIPCKLNDPNMIFFMLTDLNGPKLSTNLTINCAPLFKETHIVGESFVVYATPHSVKLDNVVCEGFKVDIQGYRIPEPPKKD